jgi:hypothetical protein
MASPKTSTARRREVRRNVPRQEPLWVQTARRREVYWGAGFAVGLALLGGLIVIFARLDPAYRLGQIVERPIVSRVDFDYLDAEELADRREDAYRDQPRVFSPNLTYFHALQNRFTELLALAERPHEQIDPAIRQRLSLSADAHRALRQHLTESGPTEEWRLDVRAFLQELFDKAVLQPADLPSAAEAHSAPIRIRPPDPLPGSPAERYLASMLSVEQPDAVRDFMADLARRFDPAVQPAVVAMAAEDPQPTYVYDPELTEQARQAARASVRPIPRPFKADTVLVPAGAKLDQAALDLIGQEREAFHAQRTTAEYWLTNLGILGMVGLIATGLWVYIFAYNHRIVRNPMRGLAITSMLIALQAAAVFCTRAWPEFFYVTATFPTLMAAVVLAIVYDQRFALAIGVLHALLVMVSLNLPVGFGVALATGLGVAVAQLTEVRNRSTVVLVGWWTGIAMGAAVLLVGLGTRPLRLDGGLQRILEDTIGALISGVAVGVVVQGLLPFIERVFKVTTAMTLKELNDAGHPLLRRLAEEAAGTYQHSLRIADMAESAAEAIGGDGLLCRVGAMYHDIGKINKPQYFIENQAGGPNRHNKLSPAMSLLIIVGHVKDGVEMAREFNLPAVLRHFIESHHGTTLVEYFYHAARKQKEAEDKPGPSEFEFRYPGPKPQTKEAAILLLCDSLEAAARALPEPTPVRLEQLVHSIANKRLMDGQFDECNITLADLHRIEQAITKTLCAIYHARIKYPSEKKGHGGPGGGEPGEKAPIREAMGTPQTATA